MSKSQPKRGEIYWVNWNPCRGSEQAGHRPALIVQNDVGNQSSSTTTVVSVSTAYVGKPYPFIVPVAVGEGGLKQASHINCSQIMTVSKDRLEDRLGTLSEERMKQVSDALIVQLALEPT